MAKRNIRVPGPGGGFKDQREPEERTSVRVREPSREWLKRPGELVRVTRNLAVRWDGESPVEGTLVPYVAPSTMKSKDPGFLCEKGTHALYLGLFAKKRMKSVVSAPKGANVEKGLIAETLPVFYVGGCKIVLEDLFGFVMHINTDDGGKDPESL